MKPNFNETKVIRVGKLERHASSTGKYFTFAYIVVGAALAEGFETERWEWREDNYEQACADHAEAKRLSSLNCNGGL